MKKKILAVVLILSMVMICGCSGDTNRTGEVNMDEETEILWYIPCANHPDAEAVFEKANEVIKEKLNLKVNFGMIEFGNYEQKMQVINAGSGEYDICFTSNWLNNYAKNVERETYMDITEMLPEYAPQLYASLPEKIWEGTKINGKIYGVINQQILARQAGICVPEPLVEEFDIDMDSLNTFGDFEPYLRKIVDKYPYCNEVGGFWGWATLPIFGFESVLGDETPPVIRLDSEDGTYEVVNQYETQEFKDYIHMRNRWRKEGLTKDSLLTSEQGNSPAYRDGKIYRPIAGIATYKPGIEVEDELYQHVAFKYKKIGEPILSVSSVTAALNAISILSENPEKSLMLLNLVNTDKDLFNLLYFGIEGVHYNKVSDNRVVRVPDKSFSPAAWVIGNQFNAYLTDDQADNIWEETIKINNESRQSGLYGFVPNTDEISAQIANCKAVVGEFGAALGEGIGDTDKLYDEFIKKLKAAGSEQLVENLNNQVKEWLESK